MIVNEQGTLYVEGDYEQGDTILSAGDWELRANGSKNAFGYNPDTFVRRNLLDFSEDFGNAVWSKLRGTVASDAIAAPDGSLTADAFVETLDTGLHAVWKSNVMLSGIEQTATLFAKKRERSILYMGDFAAGTGVYYNLDTGAVAASSAGFSGEILDVGDGWYRCKFTYTPATDRSWGAGTVITAGTLSYTGDGTSGIYIWGAQLEQASTPSDYQRTTTVVPKPTDGTITLGNGKHKDFRYYSKKLLQNEVEALTS